MDQLQHESDVIGSRRPIATRAKRWPQSIARGLVHAGLHPNHVSVASVVFAAVGGGALVAGAAQVGLPTSVWFVIAALAIQGRLLCNLLDGLMAVEEGMATTTGVLFNDVPDRLSDPILLVAAGYAGASMGDWMPALGWLAAVASLMVAYVRYVGGAEANWQDFSGPMAKQHRMFVLTVGCVGAAAVSATSSSAWTPMVFCVALVVVIVGCAFTVVRRLRHIAGRLREVQP